jgi:hypothetical protein
MMKKGQDFQYHALPSSLKQATNIASSAGHVAIRSTLEPLQDPDVPFILCHDHEQNLKANHILGHVLTLGS